MHAAICFSSERLHIRSPQAGSLESDAAALFEAVCASLPQLRQFPASLPWVKYEPSLESSRAYLLSAISNTAQGRDFPLLIFTHDGALAGCSGLHHPDFATGRFELGFWGNQALARCGYITEAAQAIIQFAFDAWQAREVYALVDDLNPRAIALCERAGMRQQALLRAERFDADGRARDTRVMICGNE
ncbi:GNAT family N-acetyltransferase [Massilia sp. W12]|uniref:GNAT family N-acetyltransferase n=1 Tax=Massilia sp. W12 TaxID=3126507 RepID=UPI0030D5804D